MKLHKILLLTLVLLLTGIVPGCRKRPAEAAGHDLNSVEVGGQKRTYLLYLPRGYSAERAYPLVVVLHGSKGDSKQIMEQTGMSAKADSEGFVVAYPQGIGRSWADGRGVSNADEKGVDDVGFMKAMLAQIQQKATIDPKRIYATGISNGGMMSNRLACDMSSTFAAIGPVAGPLPTKVRARCKPTDPISVVSIRGGADPLVKLQGGTVGRNMGEVESERDATSFWAKHDGCTGEPASSELQARVKDGTSVSKKDWGDCKAGTEVVSYVVAGMGHNWPPSELKGPLMRRIVGPSSKNLNATDVIWSFFAAHPKAG